MALKLKNNNNPKKIKFNDSNVKVVKFNDGEDVVTTWSQPITIEIAESIEGKISSSVKISDDSEPNASSASGERTNFNESKVGNILVYYGDILTLTAYDDARTGYSYVLDYFNAQLYNDSIAVGDVWDIDSGVEFKLDKSPTLNYNKIKLKLHFIHSWKQVPYYISKSGETIADVGTSVETSTTNWNVSGTTYSYIQKVYGYIKQSKNSMCLPRLSGTQERDVYPFDADNNYIYFRTIDYKTKPIPDDSYDMGTYYTPTIHNYVTSESFLVLRTGGDGAKPVVGGVLGDTYILFAKSLFISLDNYQLISKNNVPIMLGTWQQHTTVPLYNSQTNAYVGDALISLFTNWNQQELRIDLTVRVDCSIISSTTNVYLEDLDVYTIYDN